PRMPELSTNPGKNARDNSRPEVRSAEDVGSGVRCGRNQRRILIGCHAGTFTQKGVSWRYCNDTASRATHGEFNVPAMFALPFDTAGPDKPVVSMPAEASLERRRVTSSGIIPAATITVNLLRRRWSVKILRHLGSGVHDLARI